MTNEPENFLKQRTAERSENDESLLSSVYTSEDWAKPQNEKAKLSSAVQFEAREQFKRRKSNQNSKVR